MARASQILSVMGVSNFEELDVWKLATELSDLVVRMTESGPAARNANFVDQIRESSDSAAANIAEGWSRFYPTENAPFVRWAKGSLGETRNHLLLGNRRHYFAQEEFVAAMTLCRRAIGAATRYLQYLERCDGEVPGQPPRHGRRRSSRRDAKAKRQDDQGEKPEPATKNPEPEPRTRTRTRNQEPGT